MVLGCVVYTGWPVQGIWAPGMDGSDINAVARSHSGHLVATSDDLGKVNVFRLVNNCRPSFQILLHVCVNCRLIDL